MITTTLKTWIEKTRALLTNPRSLGIFALLYALLLGTLMVFISTREATVAQVAVTFVCLVLIPAEFFILQAAIVGHAREHKFAWARIPGDAVKFAVVTIPIVVLGFALVYLLNKWQVRYPAPRPQITFPPVPPSTLPVHRPTLIFATLRGLIFGVALPLLTIHLWIEVASDELRSFLNGTVLKRLGRVCARAFSSESVFIYAIGLILFVAIPYAFLFAGPSSAKGNKTEFALFIARLVFAFVFTLVGWLVTLSTLVTTVAEASPVAPTELAAAEAPA